MIGLLRDKLSGYRPAPIASDAKIRASVLIPVFENASGVRIVLTKRTDTVRYHKGEISFPGGMYEDGDNDTLATALRETNEEIGVRESDIEVIGRIDDMRTVTGFVITPYVGLIPYPYEFVLNPREVHYLIYLPLLYLLNTDVTEEEVRHEGRTIQVQSIYYEGERIWGATCRLLLTLKQIVAHAEV